MAWNLLGLNGTGADAYADGQIPVWSTALMRFVPGTLRQYAIDGGAAGDHTVPGIHTDAVLVAVLDFVNAAAGPPVNDILSLVSEFTITADDTINNTGGTDTTDGKLSVWWIDRVLTP